LDSLTVGLAFLEGMAVIVSPCILPVLPVVLSVGAQGGRWRPYGVIAGFVSAFSLFTLLSRKLVLWFGIDPERLRQVSFYLLLIFGVILLSETLSEWFSAGTQRLADIGQRLASRRNHSQARSQGFWSGVVLGSAIGLIWTPCAGPILTAVLVQTIRQETDAAGVLTVLAFGLGAGIPLLFLAIQGNRLMTHLRLFQRHSLALRRAMGLLIIATVLLTAQGTVFHWNFSWARNPAGTPTTAKAPTLVNGLPSPYPAPDFRGISAWINSPPLTMQTLRGKVVLVDFWTYSCINCVRTLPVLTAWDRRYRAQGLVIVGVHSPEFEFEKKLDNVRQAVAEHHIQYPVALDNNLDTWTNFENRYWPAHYLIDRQGRVVYTHFGEGDYDVTENNIRALLGVGKTIARAQTAGQTPGFSENQTPETYLGYARAMRFSSPQTAEPDQVSAFTFPNTLPMHHWALHGKWFIDAEKIVAQEGGAALRLRFTAKTVFLVMGVPPRKTIPVTVLLNGKPVGTVTVSRNTLYTLASQDKTRPGTVELRASTPGLSAYAFTFGD
jgi:cytochrome c biogenesis protein CcdA/thiol-disulfide isomerase/thioredoxin